MATKIVLPVTLSDIQFELEQEKKLLSSFLDSIADDIRSSMVKSFETSGGCYRCRGRGWVVIWDTLDYMDGSAADYGPCPNVDCTPETRTKSGLHPSYDRKYDYNRGVCDPLTSSDAYRCIGGPIIDQISDLSSAIRELEHRRRHFATGDRVVVVRGRKVPVGTTGRVSWVSANTGGVLVKDEDKWQIREQSGVWVDPRNLEKLAE